LRGEKDISRYAMKYASPSEGRSPKQLEVRDLMKTKRASRHDERQHEAPPTQFGFV
jgi:hypothetical protein